MTTCRPCPLRLWFCSIFICALASAAALAQSGFTAPTVDELAMRDEPKAPGAPAIVLSYDESDDADSAEVLLHVRIKVLTAGGLDAGTIELPDRIVSNDVFDRKLAARTIHANGTIVDFKATPQNSKVVGEESGDPRRVISLPDVEVGGILEYTCRYAGQNSLLSSLISWYAPVWRVQGKYFTRSAHFQLRTPSNLDSEVTRWIAHLPGDVQPTRNKDRVLLNLADIPAAPTEDYMPPASAVLYGVRFFYHAGKRDEYWGKTGGDVDTKWADYMATRKPIVAAAHELALPGDTDEQKLHKLYNAVQALDNSDLSRVHAAREDNHPARNSEEVWLRRSGSAQELTLLFVALARAAGYKAYPMAVSSRDHALFDQDMLSWSQMDSMVAIVEVKGREIYFDPGTRLCTFGGMAPWHSGVVGVSTEAKLVKIRQTPTQPYAAYRTERLADLTVAPDASVTGTVRIAWVNNAGLRLRRLALSQDKQAVEDALARDYAGLLPSTLTLKLASVEHLDDTDVPLVATFQVTGTLGVASSHRLTLPAQLFAGGTPPTLTPVTRTTPVAFPSPYLLHDRVVLHYPQTLAVEALPEHKTLNVATDASYEEKISPAKNAILAERTLILAKVDYTPAEYLALHTFFAAIADADQQQMILSKQPSTPDR